MASEGEPAAIGRRVLLKLSGELLGGACGVGLDEAGVGAIADQIAGAREAGSETAVVLGGGNVLRGSRASVALARTEADAIGMLATLVNALAVRGALERRGIPARVLSALAAPQVADLYRPDLGRGVLASKAVLMLAGGTGNSHFSTDTAAALRALELHCTLLVKGTKVDGVYDRDPALDPGAKRLETLTFSEVLARRLGVMDLTAITLCLENRLPVVVLNATTPGSVRRFLETGKGGTLIRAGD